MDREEICPYCHGYVAPLEPGMVIPENGKWEVENWRDLDWECNHCGWYWTDTTVQQATREYYENKKG